MGGGGYLKWTGRQGRGIGDTSVNVSVVESGATGGEVDVIVAGQSIFIFSGGGNVGKRRE